MITAVAVFGPATPRKVKRPWPSTDAGFGTRSGWLETTVNGAVPPVIVKVTGTLAATCTVVGDTLSASGVICSWTVAVTPDASRIVRVMSTAAAGLNSGETVNRPLTSTAGLATI